MYKAHLVHFARTENRPWNITNTKLYTSNYLLVFVCLISTSLCSCAATSFPVLGIRPDHPRFAPSNEARAWCGLTEGAKVDDCTNYRNYLEYATNLSAAYRSRATLNEWGLYAAGLIGLTGLSATAGLAATNAGIQALRIVPLVTGFASGVTAVTENKEKALNYTKAANTIDEAINEANIEVTKQSPNYAIAFSNLSAKVTKAKNDLELSRADLAARDKNIEKLVEEAIRKRLPTQLRLDDEDIEVEVDKEVKVHVMDGRAVDPARTRINDKEIADFKHEDDNKTIVIKGTKAGSTRMTFRDKDGIAANLIVVVKPKTITKTESK